MTDAPSQSQDKFIVRLPDGMRDRIKATADANKRSMNAEIVATLEEKYPAPKDRLPPDMRRVMEFLVLVEMAKNSAERKIYLRNVNGAMSKEPALSGFRIAVTEDPEMPGVFVPYITRVKADKGREASAPRP